MFKPTAKSSKHAYDDDDLESLPEYNFPSKKIELAQSPVPAVQTSSETNFLSLMSNNALRALQDAVEHELTMRRNE